MYLRNFPRQASWPISQNLPRIRHTVRDPVRRLVQNQSSILDPQLLERAPPLPAPLRQESHEQKLLIRQSRRGQSRQRRRRSRHRHNRNVMLHTQRHEPMPRIGHQRHPRVAHQRDLRALLHRRHQFRSPCHFVVFVIADQRSRNLIVRQQASAYAAYPPPQSGRPRAEFAAPAA